MIAARGTSDNAGIYAQYLLAIRNGMIVALAAPSTLTLYGARPDMADALVVGISQSGRSPDIVAVVEEARRQGALTVALTNDTDSPLAETADHVVDLCAGPELATAATKTYTTELVAAALLSTALDPPSSRETVDLAGLPALMSGALTEEPHARDLAAAHADARACSRARPRLQLRERSRVGAQAAGAGAGRCHAVFGRRLRARAPGPGGARHPGAGRGPERPRARSPGRPVDPVEGRPWGAPPGDSDSAAARQIDGGLALPDGIPPWLAPIVEILPAQLYAYHLTVARGLDPDHPRSIKKVTETR